MEKRPAAKDGIWDKYGPVLAILVAIIAIVSFCLGIGFARYIQMGGSRPPDVKQAEPYAPSASISAKP